MKDFRADLIPWFVLLDGFEVDLNRLYRPLDEFIQAFRLGMASGERGDGGDVLAVLITLDEEVELGLHLSAILG